jgi:hypothetical protein
MSGKKFTKQIAKMAFAFSIPFFVFGACASKSDVQGDPLQPPTSEAAMLDESEKSQIPDSQVFADLNPNETESNPALATGDPESSAPTNNSDAPFYGPVGGESLGRVAYTLYGKKSFSRRLLELNPSLADAKVLSPTEKVFFNFDGIAPQPTFLTKGLLDRYAGQLADGIEQKGSREGLVKGTAVLDKGETLQKLSQRLYGTTRYWTEIYLLNRDKISAYDQVKAGSDLVIYQRSAAPALAQVNTEQAPQQIAQTVSEPIPSIPQEPTEPVMPSVGAIPPPVNEVTPPVVEAPAPTPDPIPDTSVAANTEPPASQPEMATDMPKTPAFQAQEALTTGGNSNMRRIIYVVLILTIAGVAFYMTRPSKKQKFDMLDVTSGDTAGRSKLSKDSQNKNVG